MQFSFIQIVECTTPTVNGNVPYRLWVIMMCQVGSSTVTMYHLIRDVDSGVAYACLGAESKWEISVPSYIEQEQNRLLESLDNQL